MRVSNHIIPASEFNGGAALAAALVEEGARLARAPLVQRGASKLMYLNDNIIRHA